MSVRTVRKVITPSLSLSSSLIDVIVTIPTDSSNKKIPISITLSATEVSEVNNDNGSGDLSNLICYHYSIPRNSSKKEVVSAVLLDTNNDWIRDVTRQLSTLICKKYGHPCYVGWSNKSSYINAMDQLMVIKECIKFLNTVIE